MRRGLISGISTGFPVLSQSQGQVAHVLLTRSPLGTNRCCHRLALARLACVRHAASVHPEPGSNSPSEIAYSRPASARGRWRGGACARLELDGPVARDRTSLTIRPGRTGGMGDAGGLSPHRCWLIRHPDVPRNRLVARSVGRVASAPTPHDGVLALAFHTLLSFQGTRSGLSAAAPRFPRPVPAAEAPRTVARAFRVGQRRVPAGMFPSGPPLQGHLAVPRGLPSAKSSIGDCTTRPVCRSSSGP